MVLPGGLRLHSPGIGCGCKRGFKELSLTALRKGTTLGTDADKEWPSAKANRENLSQWKFPNHFSSQVALLDLKHRLKS